MEGDCCVHKVAIPDISKVGSGKEIELMDAVEVEGGYGCFYNHLEWLI